MIMKTSEIQILIIVPMNEESIYFPFRTAKKAMGLKCLKLKKYFK